MPTRSTQTRRILVAAVLVTLAAGCGGKGEKQNAAELKWNATRATVLLGLAEEQYQYGQFDKCRQTLDEAIGLRSEDARLHVLAAKLALEESRLERAEASLEYAIQLDPENAEAHYLKGILVERWQRPDQALAHYQEAARLAPGEPAYLLAEAELLAELGRPDVAIETLSERVIYFETSSAIRVALGRLLAGKGQFDLAIEYLRQATLIDRTDLEAKEELALALFAAQRWADAGDRLAELSAVPKFARRADLLVATARCQLELGRPVQARDAAQRACDLRRDDLDAHLLLAESATQADDYRRAEIGIARAQHLAPADPRAYLLEGYLRLRQGRLDEALLGFRNASERDPQCPISLCMIGYVLQRSGQPERAAYYYQQAHTLDPKDPLSAALMAGVDTAGFAD